MQNDRLSNKQTQLLFASNMPTFNSELLVDKLLFVLYYCNYVEKEEARLKAEGIIKNSLTKNLISELRSSSAIRAFIDVANLIVKKSIDNALTDNRFSEVVLSILSSIEIGERLGDVFERKVLDFVNSVEKDQLGDYLKYRIEYYLTNNNNGWNGQFYTPNSVAKLAISLFDFKDGDTIADFCSGTGNFLAQAIEHNIEKGNCTSRYSGFEIDYDSLLLSKINLAIRTMEAEVFQTDVLTNDLGKYDCVLSNPPFGGVYSKTTEEIGSHLWEPIHVDRVSRSSFTWVFMAKAINSLKEGGTAICISPQGSLFSAYESKIRQQVIEGGYLKAIITLPRLYTPYSGVSTCMLVFHKNNDGGVFFVDSERFVTGDKRRAFLTDDAIKEITRLVLGRIETDTSRFVSVDEIRESDYALIPERYLKLSAQERVSIPSAKKLEEVADVIIKSPVADSRKLTSDPTTGIRVIKSSDIEDGTYDIESLEYLSEVPNQVEKYLLEDGDILLTNKSTKIKTAIVKLSKNEKLVMFGSLYGIRINKNVCNPFYLQCFLNSNLGNLMLARLQTGTTIQCITLSNLMHLEVPCPSLKEQDRVAKEYVIKLEMLQDTKQRVEKIAKDIVEMFSKIVEE